MSIKIAENIFLKIKNQIQSIVNSHGIMGKARRSRSRSVKKCTHTFKSGRITRNPFLNFLRDFRRSNGGLKLTELTKRGAEVWRKMSDRQRSPYCHLAKQAPKRRSRRRYKRSRRRHRRRGRSVHKRQEKREDRVRPRGEDRDRYEDPEIPPKEESDRYEATDVSSTSSIKVVRDKPKWISSAYEDGQRLDAPLQTLLQHPSNEISAMYASLVILTPMLICLWVYFLIVVRENFVPKSSTSIQLNIIDAQGVSTKYRASNSSGGDNVKNGVVSKKKKLIHVPKFMLELYEKNRIDGNGDARPDVVRSVIPTHTGPIYGNEVLEELSDNHLLIFDLPTSNEDEIFIGAELKILTLLDVNTSDDQGIRKILKVSVYDDQIKKPLHHQETQIHHVNNTWVTFDVTGPVSEIFRTASKSKVLKIVISVCAFYPSVTKNLRLSLMPIREDFEHDYPVLLLSYSSTKAGTDVAEELLKVDKNRNKRSLEDDYEEETNRLWDDEFPNKKIPVKKVRKSRNTCRRKPLYIDFSEINYDVWIVQPRGYDAYQCQGRCFYPVAEHLNPTKHAIVQALLHSVAPSKASRSCCVPTILDSISILYVDTNGVLTYRYAYKDMVVLECGCR